MQQVTLSALAALISSSERARVIKNGAVVFADWGYYLKEQLQRKRIYRRRDSNRF